MSKGFIVWLLSRVIKEKRRKVFSVRMLVLSLILFSGCAKRISNPEEMFRGSNRMSSVLYMGNEGAYSYFYKIRFLQINKKFRINNECFKIENKSNKANDKNQWKVLKKVSESEYWLYLENGDIEKIEFKLEASSRNDYEK